MRNLTFGKVASNRLLVALTVIALTGTAVADQPSHSALSIWAESDDLIALHKHKASSGEIRESFVRILEKNTGYVVSEFETTPFTALVSIADGRYFAGLSNFNSISRPHGYNFAVFAADGTFLIKAFVLRGSGHCERVSQSVSQYVRWFNGPEPHITVNFYGTEVTEVLVGDGKNAEPCKFLPGDFSRKVDIK